MDDHKTKRMGSELKFLTRYAQEGDEFLNSIVTRWNMGLSSHSWIQATVTAMFDDDGDEVQEEVITWFKRQAAGFYDSGIQKLVPGLNKCLDNVGDYVEQ